MMDRWRSLRHVASVSNAGKTIPGNPSSSQLAVRSKQMVDRSGVLSRISTSAWTNWRSWPPVPPSNWYMTINVLQEVEKRDQGTVARKFQIELTVPHVLNKDTFKRWVGERFLGETEPTVRQWPCNTSKAFRCSRDGSKTFRCKTLGNGKNCDIWVSSQLFQYQDDELIWKVFEVTHQFNLRVRQRPVVIHSPLTFRLEYESRSIERSDLIQMSNKDASE